MKKLFLVLALLIVGLFTSQGAFASCNTAGVGPTDKWDVTGRCVDPYGVMWPKTISTNSQQITNQGGSADPVIYFASGSPTGFAVTYDSLSNQQTGQDIVDMGNVSSGVGFGGVYILPAAQAGLTYLFITGTKSTITIDTLTNADTIYNVTGIVTGNAIRNTSKATADSIELVGVATGAWIIKNYNGTWADSGKARG